MQISFVGFQPIQSSEHMAVSCPEIMLAFPRDGFVVECLITRRLWVFEESQGSFLASCIKFFLSKYHCERGRCCQVVMKMFLTLQVTVNVARLCVHMVFSHFTFISPCRVAGLERPLYFALSLSNSSLIFQAFMTFMTVFFHPNLSLPLRQFPSIFILSTALMYCISQGVA